MTPSRVPGPKLTSEKLTVKQQRVANRAKKVEEFQRRQQSSARNRKLGIIGAVVVTVVVVSLAVAFFVVSPPAPPAPKNAKVEGVQTFNNAAGHTDTPASYGTPPTGGEHSEVVLNCGVYTKPVPNKNAVHSLEHGALWVTYDASLGAADLATLKSKLPSTYVIVSPYENLPSKVVLSAWNVQLQIESADDERVASFAKKYWQGPTTPEPGAACSGGVDGPGKIS